MNHLIRSGLSTLAIVACLGTAHALCADYVPSWKYQTKSYSGEFRHMGGNQWAEFQNGKKLFTFLEMQYKFPYARILDKSRGITVELRATKATVHGPGKAQLTYAGAWAGPNLPKIAKSPTLRLVRLDCTETEDSGTDEVELRIYVGSREVKLRNNMKEGSTWALNWAGAMDGPVRVEVWELDSPDPDDKLGEVRIPPNVRSAHAVIQGDGYLYKLYYQVEP